MGTPKRRRRNAELSPAHKALAVQFKSSAERDKLYADQRRSVAGMAGTHATNKKRLLDEADTFAAHSQRFVQAAARVPFLSVEEVGPLARKLARATPKQVAQLAVEVLELYAKRQAYEEGVNEYLRQKAAKLPPLPVERAQKRGEQGALFEAKKYKLQTLTPGEQGSLFAPSPVSLPASAIRDRVRLDAKRAERFERDKRTRESILAELGATVRATGQAIALEGPRGNVLAVVRLTAENGRRRKPASCYCVRKNAKPLEGARIELSRAESERWHAQDRRTVAEVLAAARAAVTETGRAVTVRDVDGVAVAVAKIRPRR